MVEETRGGLGGIASRGESAGRGRTWTGLATAPGQDRERFARAGSHDELADKLRPPPGVCQQQNGFRDRPDLPG